MKKLNEWFLEVSQHEDAQEAFDQIKVMPGECTEMFFEHFEITAGIVEYNLSERHVIKKIEKAVKTTIIDSIYHSGKLPKGYQEWKERIVDINNLWRYWEEQKKAWSFGNFWKLSQEKQQLQVAKTLATIADKKDRSGTTFGGGGRPMELDKAQQIGACSIVARKATLPSFVQSQGRLWYRVFPQRSRTSRMRVQCQTVLCSLFAKQLDEDKAKLLNKFLGFLKGQQ